MSDAIRARVRDEGPLGEMASLYGAHARGNLVLDMQLGVSMHYPEGQEVLQLFRSY
ncbi:MAG: hypothetical protein GY838_04185 [bacterium]|nr:hypothetical protein [bacterium]